MRAAAHRRGAAALRGPRTPTRSARSSPRATLLAAPGDEAGALRPYEKALGRDPTEGGLRPGARVDRGERWTAAIAWLEKATLREPRYAAGWYALGYVYRRTGRVAAAVLAYEAYVALRPGDAAGRFGLAVARELDDQLDAAVADYRRYLASEADPARSSYRAQARTAIDRLTPAPASWRRPPGAVRPGGRRSPRGARSCSHDDIAPAPGARDDPGSATGSATSGPSLEAGFEVHRIGDAIVKVIAERYRPQFEAERDACRSPRWRSARWSPSWSRTARSTAGATDQPDAARGALGSVWDGFDAPVRVRTMFASARCSPGCIAPTPAA